MTLLGTTPRSARGRRLALLAAFFFALLMLARPARAQAVTGIVGSVLRLEPDGTSADSYTTGHPHPGGVPENVVNFQDCEADLRFEMELSLDQTFDNYDLVAWVGPTDCTAAAARTPGTATCWPLQAGPLPQGNLKTDAGAPATRVILRMQDIAGQAATTNPIATTYTPATNAACTVQQLDTGSTLAVYFFFVDRIGVGNAIGVAQAYPVNVDTRAETLSGITVAENLDGQLTVTVGSSADGDTVAFNFYSDPPPGQETAVNQVPYDAASNGGRCVGPDSATTGGVNEAGQGGTDAVAGEAGDDAAASADAEPLDAAEEAGPDAGATPDAGGGGSAIDDAGGNSCGVPLGDSGVPSYGSCTPGSVLQSGGGSAASTTTTTSEDGATVYAEAGAYSPGTQTLGIPSKYLMGTTAATNGSFTITGLRDGDYYTIAAAAVDGAGNVGPLAVTCAEPVAIADFWYEYTTAGGQAGGGYCSASEGVGTPAGTSGLAILAIASLIAVARRRRA